MYFVQLQASESTAEVGMNMQDTKTERCEAVQSSSRAANQHRKSWPDFGNSCTDADHVGVTSCHAFLVSPMKI